MPVYLCFPRSCYCCGYLLQIHSNKEGTGQTDRGGFNARLVQRTAVLRVHCGGRESTAVWRRGRQLHRAASGYIRLHQATSGWLVYRIVHPVSLLSSGQLVIFFFKIESGGMKTSVIVELSFVSCFRVSSVYLVCNCCDLLIEGLLCHYRLFFVSTPSFHSQMARVVNLEHVVCFFNHWPSACLALNAFCLLHWAYRCMVFTNNPVSACQQRLTRLYQTCELKMWNCKCMVTEDFGFCCTISAHLFVSLSYFAKCVS